MTHEYSCIFCPHTGDGGRWLLSYIYVTYRHAQYLVTFKNMDKYLKVWSEEREFGSGATTFLLRGQFTVKLRECPPEER